MYKAIDIAKYIVYYSNKNNLGGIMGITKLRLQRILYFVQLYFIKITGSPCFSDKIEAWSCGPIIRSVNKGYEAFFIGWIPDFRDHNVKFNTEKDRRIVEEVVDLLEKYTSTELWEMEIKQLPMKRAMARGKGKEIKISDMKDFIRSREK